LTWIPAMPIRSGGSVRLAFAALTAGTIALAGSLFTAGPPGPTGIAAAATVRATNAGAAVPSAVSPTADGRGFWVASTDGAVTPEGDAVGYGDASNVALTAPVIGI